MFGCAGGGLDAFVCDSLAVAFETVSFYVIPPEVVAFVVFPEKLGSKMFIVM